MAKGLGSLLGLGLWAVGRSAFAGPYDPPPIVVSTDEPPMIGDRNGLLFLRDRSDFVRLYPHAKISLEGHGFFGSHVDTLLPAEAGVDLGPRFLVREAQLGLGGELLQRVGFDAAIDLASNPAIDGARVDGTSRRVALSHAWAMVDQGRGLTLTMGYFEAPFTLENRTATGDLPMMERNVAIRGFVVPGSKVVGASFGGSSRHATMHWEAGGFGAESLAPGELERRFDWMSRLAFRPFAAESESAWNAAQIGVSGRVGWRNPRDASDDAPAITTGQGFALFRPAFSERGQSVHVVPSDLQWATGIELRVPFHGVVLRSEGYWVSRETHETFDEQPGTVQRAGRMSGIGWYGELSFWLLQALNIADGDPPVLGEYPGVRHLELATLPPRVDRYGLELAAIVAGVNATYDPSLRGGPAASIDRPQRIEVYQLGFGINYWQTSRFRVSFNYNWYTTPRSGQGNNLAGVPGNLGQRDTGAHSLGEVGMRMTVMF